MSGSFLSGFFVTMLDTGSIYEMFKSRAGWSAKGNEEENIIVKYMWDVRRRAVICSLGWQILLKPKRNWFRLLIPFKYYECSD